MKLAFTILAISFYLSLLGRGDTTVWNWYSDIEFQQVEIANKEELNIKANKNIIKEGKNGILWIGVNSDRLFRFNGYVAFDVYEYISQQQDSLFNGAQPLTFCIDEKENIWLGTDKGLYRIRTTDFYCEKIILDQALLEENYRNQITILQEHGDTIFVGTKNGLYLLDKREKEVLKKFFTNGSREHYTRGGTSTAIRGIYFSQSSKYLWLSINGQMCALDLISGSFQFFPEEASVNQQRWLKQGYILKDSLILSPSDGLGLVAFNTANRVFSNKLIHENENYFESNRINALIPLNDSVAMLSALNWGTGLYNSNRNEYYWLSVPSFLKFGHHGLDIDPQGYVWSGLGANLFRTKRSIMPSSLSAKPIIDVSSIEVNNVQRGIPFLENYPVYQLKEYERSIELTFSMTHHHLFDEILFEYQLNSRQWLPLDNPHHLLIYGLAMGKNKLKLRAQVNGETIAERELILEVYFPFYKSFWFYLSITVLLLGFGAGFIRYKIAQVRKEERLRADFSKKLAETESMALRSQINPHFIFNTLNSIKYYAVAKSPTETGEFISRFSALIRQVLENSKQHLIPLREELSMLNNYIEVEKMRFRDAFESSIKVDPAIDQDFFLIPPSLLQPFVENSIWHGLMHKEGEKKLKVIFSQEESRICCQIIDNGIGREAAAKINKSKTAKSSLGMQITKDRIEHLKTLYGIESQIEIIDLYDEAGSASGTQVQISFSI